MLIITEAQAAGSESHSVNSLFWLLEEVKTTGFTNVGLMQNIMFFSIVSSHRQVVAYLH